MKMPPLPPIEDAAWAQFVCTSCGEQTYVALDDSLTAADQLDLLDLLFGDPRVCSSCQTEFRMSA